MNTLASALSYAQRGWKLVRLFGVTEPEVCTCWKERDCANPGKHPVEKAWQTLATDDEEEIASWFESGEPVNIGIVLGEPSGIIDVELDSDEAKAAWEELKLGEIWTPTYSSGRGPHRLFKWTDDLPHVSVRKPMGIEIRIGNGSGMQSVLPPSRHHTGAYYSWVPGLSPGDIEPMELPERLKALLWNEDSSGASFSRAPARSIIATEVAEGSRNDSLYRFTVREAFRLSNIDDPSEQSDLLDIARAINVTKCKPPLPDSEVVALYRSAVQYVRKTRSAGVSASSAIQQIDSASSVSRRKAEQGDKPMRSYGQSLTASGLSYKSLKDGEDPEWCPGEWTLTVVHSDPLEYRLHSPAWIDYTAAGTGNVSLTVDQYCSATKVARAILAATGTVMLDDEPGKWRKIWDGGERIAEARDKDHKILRSRRSRGVKAKLIDNAAHEWPGSSSLRYVHLAGWLYDRLSQAAQPNDEDTPDSTGRAAWRKDGTLWFSWSRVWEDIERQHRVLEGERLSTKRRLLASIGDGAKDFRHGDFRHAGGSRKSYVVWTTRELGVLELMATENQDSKREEYGSDSTTDRSSGHRQDNGVAQDHGGGEASNREQPA